MGPPEWGMRKGAARPPDGGVKLPQGAYTPGVAEFPWGDKTPGGTTASESGLREDGWGRGGSENPTTF